MSNLSVERLRQRFATLFALLPQEIDSTLSVTLLCDGCGAATSIAVLELRPPSGWYIGEWGHDLCETCAMKGETR